MYIDIVPNRGSPPAILLRESIREGKRVRKRTIANLSALPVEQAEMIRRVLKGEKLGPVESALEVVRSQAHGHVACGCLPLRIAAHGIDQRALVFPDDKVRRIWRRDSIVMASSAQQRGVGEEEAPVTVGHRQTEWQAGKQRLDLRQARRDIADALPEAAVVNEKEQRSCA